eukprot:NODE_620_length_5338_cov_0.498568.p2 type:complete len:173 gc:universal NODE_620_length_5338_cov_0.498568:476-994(+)
MDFIQDPQISPDDSIKRLEQCYEQIGLSLRPRWLALTKNDQLKLYSREEPIVEHIQQYTSEIINKVRKRPNTVIDAPPEITITPTSSSTSTTNQRASIDTTSKTRKRTSSASDSEDGVEGLNVVQVKKNWLKVFKESNDLEVIHSQEMKKSQSIPLSEFSMVFLIYIDFRSN